VGWAGQTGLATIPFWSLVLISPLSTRDLAHLVKLITLEPVFRRQARGRRVSSLFILTQHFQARILLLFAAECISADLVEARSRLKVTAVIWHGYEANIVRASSA